MKRMVAIAIASASTLALVFAVLIWRPWKSVPSLVDQIRSLGFTPVTTPSTLAAPGSLVMIVESSVRITRRLAEASRTCS